MTDEQFAILKMVASLENWKYVYPDEFDEVDQEALEAGRQAIEQAQKQEALDKKADNAIELGLDYEPEPIRLECVKCGTVYADGIPPKTTQKQEPVAWMRDDEMKAMVSDEKRAWILCGQSELIEDYNKPLYTSPPQRQPLTDAEFAYVWREETGRIMGTDKALLLRAKQITEAAHGIGKGEA